MEKFGNEELTEALNSQNVSKKCHQRCELQTETPTFTSSVFPIESTFSKHHFYCLTLTKLARICNDSYRAKIFEDSLDFSSVITCKEILNGRHNSKLCLNSDVAPNATLVKQNHELSNFILKYARNNLALLNVLIKDPYYTLIKRDEQITLITFMANAGGLMGLCMGLGVVSIFEIFYHTINFVINKFRSFIV